MFDLGKFLRGAVAQVNPWDNGADFNSVVNPKKKQQPQQQAPPQRFYNQGPQQNAPQQQQAQSHNFFTDAFNNVSKFNHQNYVNVGNFFHDTGKAIADDATKAANTVAIPLTGMEGLRQAGIDQLFNGGKNTNNILGGTQEAINNDLLPKSLVPQNVAQGKASPLEFGGDIAATGIHYAPYAMGGAGGIADKLGGTVAENLASRGLGSFGSKAAGKAASYGADAAVSAPTFAGLNAAQQGVQAVQNGGQTGFDPMQAVAAGGQAALMTAGGRLAGDVGKAGVTATRHAPQAVQVASQVATDLTNAPVKKMAAQHPAVLGHDDQYSQLAQQFDNTPDPAARRQISQAMADNRAARLQTMRQVERQMGQGGFIKNPLGEDASTPTPPQSIDPRLQGNPELQAPITEVPVQTGQVLPQEQALQPQSLPNNTPNLPVQQVDTQAYLAAQKALQEQARKAGTNTLLHKVKNDVSTKLIDSLSPIENTLKQANKDGAGIKIGDANHITPQLDRALRADTIASQYMKDNGLAHVIQHVPDTKAFDQYLIAKHAADLEKQGIKTGRNSAADAQLVKELAPTYEPHAKAVMKYNQGLLDKSVEYGLVSKELAASLKKQYPNYVPANRIFGDGEKPQFNGTGGGKASRSTQTVVQRIKGSERQIESPLSSIAAKTQDVIKQGEANKAASILASYKDLPGNPFNLRELSPSETVGAKSTIAYLDNGKVRHFETTPEIEAAAKSLNKEQIGILGKIVRVPTRVLRLGATGVNVGFAMANVAKDLVSAAINSNHPFETSVLNPKVAGKAFDAAMIHSSPSYAELVREGAGGTSFDIARDAPVQNVAKIRAEKNIGTKALYTVRHPGELLRAVENTIGRSEEFTRALQYYGNKEAALKKGMSGADAVRYGAHAARNNTVNFARAGEYGAVLNSALPYLNAGIQGSRTFLRNVKERPAQTVAKVAILSTLPALTTTAWNLSDQKRRDAYKDISEYEKQGNLIIVPENPVKDPNTGRWNVIKIPVSQEIANLNNIARNSVEAAAGAGEATVAGILGDLIGTTTSINAQDPRQIISQITPQALKPMVETVTNQNLYTGNKIVPDSQKNLPAPDQSSPFTSGTSKVLGKTLGLSPEMLDNGFRTTTGGAGQTAINASDSLLAQLGLIKPGDIKGKNIGDTVTNRFFGAASKPASAYADKAYADASKQLINSPGYKALSSQDKAKALNRLRTDTNSIEYNKYDALNPNNQYAPTKLTKNQKALASGSRKPTDYTTPSTGSSTPIAKSVTPASKDVLNKYDSLDSAGRTKWFSSQNDAEYQYNKAKYENDKANGTLTKIADIRASKSLKKDEIGSKYSKDARDLYGMSKADIYAYVSKDPNGNKLANELLAYDKALKDAGLVAYAKFRTGIMPTTRVARGRGGGRKGRGGSRGSRGSSFKMPSTSVANIAARSTYSTLQHLLAGTTAKTATASKLRQPIGKKAAVQKITVKA